MKKLFAKLQKVSNTVFGVNLLNDAPKSNFQVFKKVFFIVFLIVYISFALQNLKFGSHLEFHIKLLLLCMISAALVILVTFTIFCRSEAQYKMHVNWVLQRYLPKRLNIVDEISKIEFEKCSKLTWNIVK